MINIFITNVCAVIIAAGFGSRMKIKYPKQYFYIGNKSILEYSLALFLGSSQISRVVVVINRNHNNFMTFTLHDHPNIIAVDGGVDRAHSVLAGIRAAGKAQWILVHDAARPCLHKNDLTRLLAISNTSKVGAILATPVRDTIKRAQPNKNIIAHTVDRINLWQAQTPQFFPRKLLYDCLVRAINDGIIITDEASALEYCGFYPELIKGRSDNIKITYQEDLSLVRSYLSKKNIGKKRI